jgi:hypothetical protein
MAGSDADDVSALFLPGDLTEHHPAPYGIVPSDQYHALEALS